MPEEPAWSREDVEDLLRRESFRYQAIPLPHGITTEGHDRSGTADLIFPRDLSGQSVMDVGSALGFFCFEARRRGAGRVLGIELDAENVRKSRLLARVKGEAVEFRRLDVERDAVEERFDHVLCLNVLHHLADPIHAIDRLIGVAKRRLVLEVATLGAHDRKKLGMNRLEQLLVERLPAVLVSSGAESPGIKQFYFTRRSMENLLRFRRGCFASVAVLPSDFKGRFLVVGRKYRIGRLLVVAAATAPEAARLAGRLRSGELGTLGPDAAGGADLGTRLVAADHHEDHEPDHDRLLFEYDLLRPVAAGAMSHDHDPATEIVDTAEEVLFVTAWHPPEALLARMDKEQRSVAGRARKRLERLVDQCRDPRRLAARHREWLSWVRRRHPAARHVVVTLDGGRPRVLPAEEWEATVARPLLGSDAAPDGAT